MDPDQPRHPLALEALRACGSGRCAPRSQCTRAPGATPNRGRR